MSAAALNQLRAELGDQADDLQYAPLSAVVTKEQEHEPAALSFKIKFGCVREKHNAAIKRQVWVLFIPSSTKENYPSIMFHSYEESDDHEMQYDAENIHKVVTGCERAFKHTKLRSKAKVLALAKYYFLVKASEFKSEEDEDKIRAGALISKTFVDDLKTACRVFKEEAKRLSAFLPINNMTDIRTFDLQVPDSDLSDAPPGFLESAQSLAEISDISQASIHTESGDSLFVTVSWVLCCIFEDKTAHHLKDVDTKELVVGVAKKSAVEVIMVLDDDGERIAKEISKIDEEISVLKAKREALARESHNILTRKQGLILGMEPSEAYNLGRDIERLCTAKRRRKG